VQAALGAEGLQATLHSSQRHPAGTLQQAWQAALQPA